MRKLKNEELGRISLKEARKTDKIPVAIVLDNVRSLYNVGAVFRTADAFKVEKVFLCGITAKPPHREIHKTALGAEESVDWDYFKNVEEAVEQIKKENYTLIAIEQAVGSKMLQDFKPDKDHRYAIVFGHEVKGVSQYIMDNAEEAIELPQFGIKHSLNISVSVGVVIWDIFAKLNFYK